ncbi:MAG: LysM peptidoglycan-binding domain-containing protein, partial [Gammaproteobacteria bacterium]|nr:LysM peptidoglycan-binding domain-containing protein [Gammaproteobacteria bacterium]
TLPVDAYQTTAQNTTISPSDNIDHYKIDTNTDNLAAFIETLPESDLPTLILPIEDIQPVENNNELSVITPKPLKSETIIYTVVKGDTFWAIAERFVNNPYKYTELAEQNKIMNPDRIYPGNKIRIIKISR